MSSKLNTLENDSRTSQINIHTPQNHRKNANFLSIIGRANMYKSSKLLITSETLHLIKELQLQFNAQDLVNTQKVTLPSVIRFELLKIPLVMGKQISPLLLQNKLLLAQASSQFNGMTFMLSFKC
ncbi:hypothetical protein Pfo_013380 [Paulownia fortunei]|nr:hypothetical protein Pfo_013380 [Paulownia fortunei]